MGNTNLGISEGVEVMIRSFRELLVWQRSIYLATLVYRLTQGFPREETYGLSSQMRRCAVSIPSNIAEGHGMLNAAEYRQFLGISRGSNFELQTQLLISRELGIGRPALLDEAEALSHEVGKMLHSIIAKLKK